jgi:hypothetical protein
VGNDMNGLNAIHARPRTSLRRGLLVWVSTLIALACGVASRADDRLIGSWTLDEGFQTLEYTFRSDGRYQLETRSTDPFFDFRFLDLGRYAAHGTDLLLQPDEYFGEPTSKRYAYLADAAGLTLTNPEFSIVQFFRFRAGSKEDVLARESAEHDLIGTWRRSIANSGTDDYTFRPGGYYVLKRTPSDAQFPPEFIRGRYVVDGTQLAIHPYNGVEVVYETDFFGTSLSLIRREETYGETRTFDLLDGSRSEVRRKAAEAEAFLGQAEWYVGVWEIRDPFLVVDLTMRPDGRYIAVHSTEFQSGVVRGRFVLEPGRIQLGPFVGQDPYAMSNGDFGKSYQTRAVDYYDGELQFIDLGALSQSVRIARKRVGSEAPIREKVRQSHAERRRDGWHVGIWEVRDPVGWMQFTFRPDGRYIALNGADGQASQGERGRYVLGTDKFTLAPYVGAGAPRGFETDFYDGELFLVGDRSRLVIARKVPGSEDEVTTKTDAPEALNGELGSILGLWSAPLPGQSSALVFRDDGEFRLDRCAQGTTSRDFGLYSVDMTARTLVLNSRLAPVQTLELDFYGNTLTLHGGLAAPSTYQVQLGKAETALQASFAADLDRETVDAQWLVRVPVGPRDPNAVQLPAGNIPADPNPNRIFEAPTVLTRYQLFRRLIPGFVYFNVQGAIRSVAVVNTREWHFFPTGRVLVRFKNYFAGPFYPSTLEEVSDSWGAYHVGPQPIEEDILHRYADNTVFLDMDSGDRVEMTLEDGRRHLFWEKDYQIQSEWAAEQKPVPCESPADVDRTLLNQGVSLSTDLPPDALPGQHPVLLGLTRAGSGGLLLHGSMDVEGSIVIERIGSLTSSGAWTAVQTNQVAAGEFSVPVAPVHGASAFFRLRKL